MTEATLLELLEAWEEKQRVRTLALANAVMPHDRAGLELAALYSRAGCGTKLPFPPLDLTVRHIFPTHRRIERTRDVLRFVKADLLTPFAVDSSTQLTLDGMVALRVPTYRYAAGPVLLDVLQEGVRA